MEVGCSFGTLYPGLLWNYFEENSPWRVISMLERPTVGASYILVTSCPMILFGNTTPRSSPRSPLTKVGLGQHLDRVSMV
jgi:hypothetical protein